MTLGYSVAHVAGGGGRTREPIIVLRPRIELATSRVRLYAPVERHRWKTRIKEAAHYSPVSSSNLGTSPVIVLRPAKRVLMCPPPHFTP